MGNLHFFFLLLQVRNKVPHTTGQVTLPERLQEMNKIIYQVHAAFIFTSFICDFGNAAVFVSDSSL